MKFIIRIKDITFEAKDGIEAEIKAIDIVNDIGHNGDYKLIVKKHEK